MTAVEWLIKELNQKIDFIPMNKWDEIRDLIQQALEMEEQQRGYTEEQVKEVIYMARTLVDGKNEFDVEGILGSSDGTYGIKQKYTEEQIIQSLKQPKQ